MKMNALRGIMHFSLRGYRSNAGNRSARRVKTPRVTNFVQPGMPVQDFIAEAEEEDVEDLDSCEAEFKSVNEYKKMHEREMEVEKAKVMTQIVKRKYFKSNEPAMLTWGEKEQIRYLHKEDPEEWTPDKLSDSFPASREAILKILKSDWAVKSVKVVERYEKNVKENWALLKAGKLNINPELKEHLEKFKNREFKTTDPEIIAKKIVKPKPVFPKPQSTLFSSIIQSYRNVNPARRDDDEDDDEIPVKTASKTTTKSFEEIMSDKSSVKQESKELTIMKKLTSEKKIWRNQSLTFDEFLQKHVEGVEENKITPVDRVLIDELKEKSTEAYKNESLILVSASPVAAWKNNNEFNEKNKKVPVTSVTVSESEKMCVEAKNTNEEVVTQTEKPINKDLEKISKGTLETGIIAREKTETALLDDYPEFIKIPPKQFKAGATYRVQDRYYDDDGELLYRVPGLKA